MGKNGYLANRDQLMQKFFMVACDTTTQQFFDYMCIVLNDPEIMGKDTFGAKRLKKVYPYPGTGTGGQPGGNRTR